MPDYQKMYQDMFRAITEAITILQKAQQDSEEAYMSDDPPVIKLLNILPPEHPISSEGTETEKLGTPHAG